MPDLPPPTRDPFREPDWPPAGDGEEPVPELLGVTDQLLDRLRNNQGSGFDNGR